jgi:5'-3' exonuclease
MVSSNSRRSPSWDWRVRRGKVIVVTAPLVLLDSASLYFRAFYGVPDSLVADDGTPVNAVRGFIDTLARILTERHPSRMVACLDADWRPQFRVDLLPSYKAHRVAEQQDNSEEVPDALSPQVPIILEVLEATGIATAEASGYEADDVIGALAYREKRDPVEVITGDRDLFQLVRREPTPASVVYVGRGWAKAEVLGPQEIADKYGVPVKTAGSSYADMSVLRGDPSDGLPGVAGIGEKTAAKLITEFGSLAALLHAVEAESAELPAKTRARLMDASAYLQVAPQVVRTAVDAPVVVSGDDRVPATVADPDQLAELSERWNLGGSVQRLLAALAR